MLRLLKFFLACKGVNELHCFRMLPLGNISNGEVFCMTFSSRLLLGLIKILKVRLLAENSVQRLGDFLHHFYQTNIELLVFCQFLLGIDRKSTRLNSSHVKISYAVFC